MAVGSVRRRVLLVALVGALGVSTLGVPSSAGAVAALPVVKVSPSTGLVDLQNVTVTGTGFAARVQIGTVECRPGALSEPDCDLGTLVYAQADQHGKFTLHRPVRRLISVGGKTTDCGAAKGCIIGAGNVTNLKQANGQTIFFNPKVPPKVATITVSPPTKLVDHQLVTVSGKGFAPAANVYLSQCVTKPPAGAGQVCDYATQRYVAVDSHGAFTANNVVLERRQVLYTKKGTQTLDCAVKTTTCEIQANTAGLGSSTPARAGLAFDPNVAPAVATAQLSPSSALHDLEEVTLTGSGFTPGYQVSIQECVLGSAKSASCDYTTSRAVTADFHGAFTFTYTVRRNLAVFVAPTVPTGPTSATDVDCATKATLCELTIQGSSSQPATTIGLTFDPNTPTVTSTITATPNTGLSDNQPVTVSLTGFTPHEAVQVIECSAEAISEGNLSYCDYTTGQTITPTAASSDTTFVVRAVLSGQTGLDDCTTQPGACVLVATENGGYYGGGVIVSGPIFPNIASTPLTFSPH